MSFITEDNKSCTISCDNAIFYKSFFDMAIDTLDYEIEYLNSEEVKEKYSKELIDKTLQDRLNMRENFKKQREVAPE